MKKYLPIFEWLPNYPKAYFKNDLTAGLIVGIMLIPQGMAYALIAGLPPVYGLYAALIPQAVYAVMGTSRQLSVAPVAMDSLLVAAGLSTLAVVGSVEYIELAILLALLMGSIQFLFGVFRLGFLVNFLSRPVISGFTSAAAFIIGLNQLKDFTGIDTGRSNQIQTLVYQGFNNIEQIHWFTLILGVLGILILQTVKNINKKYRLTIPGSLIVVVLGILAVVWFDLEKYGVKIVGEIPQGFPLPSIPDWSNPALRDLLAIAFPLALIAFMEAISVSKAMQMKNKDHEIRPNQELIALGMANIIGSFFRAFPTTGGFSRTAVNEQAGAKTGMASLVSAVFIALVLLFLTPVFYFLPKAILAAIIIVAVYGLVDTKYPKFLWKNKKDELLMLLVTFIVTLTVGIQEGILIGVFLSLILVIYLTTQPHYAVLGCFPDTQEYRNVSRFEEVITRQDVLIVRYDASLYFANLSHFQETMRKLVQAKMPNLKLLILNAESINTVDASALEMLNQWVDELKKQHIQLYMTGVKGPVRDALHRSGVMQKIEAEKFFLHIQEAVDFYDQKNAHWVQKSNQYARQSNVS